MKPSSLRRRLLVALVLSSATGAAAAQVVPTNAALQAQIEPHFLFNTLANIKLLYETESARAKPLIHDLAAYLRTALPQMRGMRSTLARELDERILGVLTEKQRAKWTSLLGKKFDWTGILAGQDF